MALGKYTRVDNKRASSNYCSTVTIVVFVALCLVGVWMMTSSSVIPVQNVDVPQESKSEVKEQVIENSNEVKEQANGNVDEVKEQEKNGGNTGQFEDNPGDLPEDATKGDTNDTPSQSESNSNSQKNQEQKQDESVKMSTGDKESSAEETKSIDNESNEEAERSKTDGGNDDSGRQGDSEEVSGENKSDTDETEKKTDSEESSADTKNEEKVEGEIEEKTSQNGNDGSVGNSDDKKDESQTKDQFSSEVFPSGAQSDLLNETTAQNGAFSTQAAESKNEKESQGSSKQEKSYSWKQCNVTAGPDYIPCLDNLQAIRRLKSTKHYEHRERHCPENPPTCLVALPKGYRKPVEWPTSREKIWYYNIPHTKLAEVKGHQNWVKVTGEYLTFPGGGTQFKHGALHYIDFIQESVPDIAWGKRSRVILDVGCGVASFGGFLFDRDVLAMSLAPKDEHEAQVQFALERGIPAISAVMGTTRLPFPSRVFDIVHCARCRVPWHIEGGKLLLELNRLLRPGGFFVWSATPVYQKNPEDVAIWKAMSELIKSMCWELISINKDTLNGVGVATYRKPMTNDCYEKRSQNDPPMCADSDDANAAWYVPLQSCMHKIPIDSAERGSQWPEEWPARLVKTPYWLLSSQVGVYGKSAPEDFASDNEHWKRVVTNSYLSGIGIDWSTVRNAMDMRAIYGGFAAALKELNVWVMNVVSVDAPDTLPIIYERGLFGIYHDWCESFSTYPRSYDLLHADHLFSKIKKRCNLVALVAEVDRILRPGGKLIVRDDVETIDDVASMVRAMLWEFRLTYSKDNEGLLCVQKSMWRPSKSETVSYAIA